MSNIEKRFSRLREKESSMNNKRIRAEADLANVEKAIEKKFGKGADLKKIETKLTAKKVKLEVKLNKGLKKLEDEYIN